MKKFALSFVMLLARLAGDAQAASAPTPDPAQEANWLPAPDGLMYVAMRLYWPKPAVLNGQWTAPPLQETR